MNLITPDIVATAAGSVRSGRAVSCAVPLDDTGPVYPGRSGIFHGFTYTGTDYVAKAPAVAGHGAYHVTDDVIFMPLQASTQWDGLAHAGSHQMLYNGFWIGNVAARGGARRCAIDRMRSGIQGRGLLLDLAGNAGAERLLPGHAIGPDELDACLAAQGVATRGGDILVIRTGHVPWWYRLEDKQAFWADGAPGLSLACVDWLHERDIAAVAMDNIAIEVQPFEEPCEHPFPVHGQLIRDLGMSLGEIWWLEDLVRACHEEGRWDFFLVATPLNITNAAGSPINPIAFF